MRAPRSYGRPVVYLSEDLAAALLGESLPAVGAELAGTFRESYSYEPTTDLVLENVCGLWPGSDPALRNEVLIVSAHYDHVGTSGGEIYNGADDNGSGTTGLLQIADALAAYGPMRRTVMLIWVSAEEKGLLGSRAWTQHPWLPEGMRPVCDLNIDMIGRNAPNEIGITPTQAREEYNRLTQLVEQNAPLEGFTKLNSADAYWSRSDHAMFAQNLGIPVAFLFSDVHEDYHKPTDTADKIDCDKLCRVARLVVRVLHELQTDELNLGL
jgi:Zn-dependent M28 family amino/carboxypeptidase